MDYCKGEDLTEEAYLDNLEKADQLIVDAWIFEDSKVALARSEFDAAAQATTGQILMTMTPLECKQWEPREGDFARKKKRKERYNAAVEYIDQLEKLVKKYKKATSTMRAIVLGEDVDPEEPED